MRYSWITSLLLCLTLAVGCSQENSGTETGEVVDNAASKESETPSAEKARAHVQESIDRLMGGDESVKTSLLGMDGVDFGTIDSVEITSLVQEYSPEGKKLDGWFRVVLLVNGVDGAKGRKVSKSITRTASYSDGTWSLMFNK